MLERGFFQLRNFVNSVKLNYVVNEKTILINNEFELFSYGLLKVRLNVGLDSSQFYKLN